MKIVEELLTYYELNRQSGTTDLIKEVIKTYDANVIVANAEEGKSFIRAKTDGSKSVLVSLERLNDGESRGHFKPILIDNHAMIVLLQKVLETSNDQVSTIKDLAIKDSKNTRKIVELESDIKRLKNAFSKLNKNYVQKLEQLHSLGVELEEHELIEIGIDPYEADD